MVLEVNVKGDVKEAVRFLNRVQRKHVPQAVASALNRTMISVRAASTKEIRRNVSLLSREIKSEMTIRKASKVKQFTRLIAKARDLPLTKFKPKEKQLKRVNIFGAPLKSVSVKTSPKRRRKVIKRGFFAYGRSSIVQRAKGAVRGPLKKLFGPAIDYRFDAPTTRRIMADRALEQFPKNFENQIQRILRRTT